jgi:hypothetical protein
MRPNKKTAFPHAAVLFILGAMGLYCLNAGILDIRGRLTPPRLRFNSANISPDGEVTFIGVKNLSGRIRTSLYYAFDESVKTSRELPDYSNLVAFYADLEAVKEKRPDAVRRQFFEVALTEGLPVDLNVPLIWWNGYEGQFDVYDRLSRLRTASIGPNGLAPVPGRPEGRFTWIRGGGTKGIYFGVVPDAVYCVQLPSGNVREIFRGPIDAFCSYSWDSKNYPQINNPPVPLDRPGVFVQSGGKLMALDDEGNLLLSIPVPEVLTNYNYYVSFPESGYIRFQGWERNKRNRWSVKRAILLSPDGRLVREIVFDQDEIQDQMNGGKEAPFPFPTLLPPLPVLMTTPALIQSIILSLILAGWVAWRETRRGSRGGRRAAWTIFTFLTGIAGVAAYHTVYWDVRTEPCPGCERLRPVTEERCPHCSIPWPAPEKIGIEVVEPS